MRIYGSRLPIAASFALLLILTISGVAHAGRRYLQPATNDPASVQAQSENPSTGSVPTAPVQLLGPTAGALPGAPASSATSAPAGTPLPPANVPTAVSDTPAHPSSAQPAAATATKDAAIKSAPPAPLPASNTTVKGAAQPNSTETGKTTLESLSNDALAQKIEQLQAAIDPNAPDHDAIKALYDQALDNLKHSDEQTADGKKIDAARLAVPYQLKSREQEAASAAALTANTSELPADKPLSDWEQLLSAAEQELETARTTAADFDNEHEHRAARRLEIPKAIAAARMKINELDQSAQSPSDSSDLPALAKTKKILAETQRRAARAEIATLDKELQSYGSESTNLLKLDRDAAAAKVAKLQQQVAAWRDAISKRRQELAAREAAEAHWAAATAEPAVRQLADENSSLADQNQSLADKINTIASVAQDVQQRLDKITAEFSEIKDKVKAAGLTDAVGQMLRKDRADLATSADLRAIHLRQDEIAAVQLQIIDLEEQLAGLHDLDRRAKQIVAALPAGTAAKLEDVQSLLQKQDKYLQRLLNHENEYFSKLVNLDAKQQEFVSHADGFRDYIDERVLWIRSAHPYSTTDFRRAAEATWWLVKPSNWWTAVGAALRTAGANLPVVALAVGLLAALLAAQRRLRIAVRKLGNPTAVARMGWAAGGPIRRGWEMALATLLIAAPWPAALWFVGWLFATAEVVDASGFSAALGIGLQAAGTVLLPLMIVRNICRREGLAEIHFGWPETALANFRHHLSWLMACGAPLIVAVAMLDSQANDAWKDSLGRALFVACQILLAAFLFVVLRPQHGALNQLMMMRRGSWAQRLAMPTFLMLVMAPLAMIALSLAGYFYTAQRLAGRLQASVWLVLSLVVVQAFSSRWLMAYIRRLAIHAAVLNAETGATEKSTGAVALSIAGQSSKSPADDPPPEIDLEKIDEQTHRLLHTLAVVLLGVGLYFIWVDVLPALRFFDSLALWSDGVQTISLANLFEGCLAGAMTIVALCNLPGLLEIALLERLPLDNGVRYALLAVTRYTIVVVGLTLAGGAVGIGWPKLQWLAAAATFGLGFGLQEIFANFVSGLIVLFERPIRVGDTVTVGDVTGVVSRIHMRATTIVDGDRKELIVPNKEFITAKLVNWTLTDSVVRLVIRLGIAYGSDAQQVQQLLLRIAESTPSVLKNPAPRAVFMGFSEKWIDFELRVFVGSVDALVPTRHKLNMAIDRTFRAAGVEFATPPREFGGHAEASDEPASEAVGTKAA